MNKLREIRLLEAYLNIEKENYSKNESETNDKYERIYQVMNERERKFKLLFTGLFFFFLTLSGVIYAILNNYNKKKYIVYFIILFFVILLALKVCERVYRYKKNNALKIIEENDKEKKEIRERIKEISESIENLIIAHIVVRHNIFELALIKDPEKKKKRYRELVLMEIASINSKYNYAPTIEEYKEYYIKRLNYL